MHVTSTLMFGIPRNTHTHAERERERGRERIQNLWERYGKPPCQAEYLWKAHCLHCKTTKKLKSWWSVWSLKLNNTTRDNYSVNYLHLFYLCNLPFFHSLLHLSLLQLSILNQKVSTALLPKYFEKIRYQKCIRQAKEK